MSEKLTEEIESDLSTSPTDSNSYWEVKVTVLLWTPSYGYVVIEKEKSHAGATARSTASSRISSKDWLVVPKGGAS